jgi:hypothetical protein
MENANNTVLTRRWFKCPVCGYKIMQTDERQQGGAFILCNLHKGEVEIIHQPNGEVVREKKVI